MEINPEHPVTKAVHDDWHKIVAILLHKLGIQEIAITANDIDKLMRAFPDMPTVILRAEGEILRLQLVSLEEGKRAAAKE